jgi:hypothetical protein
MRVDRADRIGGQPIKAVRDFLPRLGASSWSTDRIAEHFAIDQTAGAALIAELVQRKLLEQAEPWPGDPRPFYRQGAAAPRLAAARFLKPIDRERATRLLDEFLQRVNAVDANDDLVFEVAEVRIFGSYLDPNRSELGDLDLVVTLTPRGGRSHEEATRWSLAKAVASERRFSNYVEQLSFARDEVLRQLKARKPYLSIHSPEDVDRIGVESRVVFRKQADRSKGK